MAKDILLTHAMFVVACAKPEDKHLGTVRALASKGGAEQRALLDAMTAYGAKKVAPLARQIAEGAQSIRDLLGADMTYAGVKFQIDTMVASLRSQTVVESMNAPESDPRAIRLDDLRTGKPMTIYIHVPPQNLKSHAALIDLWVSAIITTIAARTPAERPEKNTLIILDECGQYHVTALRMALTLMRGAGLTMCCIFQSPSMLMADYAKDWRAIAENCGVIQAFGFQSATFTESACQILGWSDPQGLMRLGKDQQLVSTVDGSGPFICERPNYLLDARYTSYCNPNPWHRFKEQPQPTRGLDAASRYPQPRTGRSGGPYAA